MRLTGDRPDNAEANQAEHCVGYDWQQNETSDCTNCDHEYD